MLICDALVNGYVPKAADNVPPPRSRLRIGGGPLFTQKSMLASLSTKNPLIEYVAPFTETVSGAAMGVPSTIHESPPTVGVGVGLGGIVLVGRTVAVAVRTTVGVAVALGIGVALGTGVALGMAVGVAALVGVALGGTVGERVAVGLKVGVGVGATHEMALSSCAVPMPTPLLQSRNVTTMLLVAALSVEGMNFTSAWKGSLDGYSVTESLLLLGLTLIKVGYIPSTEHRRPPLS